LQNRSEIVESKWRFVNTFPHLPRNFPAAAGVRLKRN
jgi:hypothetical protein